MQTLEIKFHNLPDKANQLFVTLFSELHPILANNLVAFEIFATDSSFALCFTAQEGVLASVSALAYNLIPEVEINSIQDPCAAFHSSKHVCASQVSLERSQLLPILSAQDDKHELLNILFQAISNLAPGESTLVQIVLQPMRQGSMTATLFRIQRRILELGSSLLKKVSSSAFSSTISVLADIKFSRPLYLASIRIASANINADSDARVNLRALSAALERFRNPGVNALKPGRIRSDSLILKDLRERELRSPVLLSAHEIAGLFHVPSTNCSTKLNRLATRRLPPPASLACDLEDMQISFFAKTNYRRQQQPFGVMRSQRKRSLCVLGKRASGKSSLLKSLIREDIETGQGVAVFDDKGILIDDLLKLVPENRIKDVILFDVSDSSSVISFNPFRDVPSRYKSRIAVGIVESFKLITNVQWTLRLEHVFRYAVLALLDIKGATLLTLPHLLCDATYRERAIEEISDAVIKHFWVHDYPVWCRDYEIEVVETLRLLVTQIVSNQTMLKIFAEAQPVISFQDIISNSKLLMVRLPRDQIGGENVALLGSLLLNTIYQAALELDSQLLETRKNLYIYLDSISSFAQANLGEVFTDSTNLGLNFSYCLNSRSDLPESLRKISTKQIGTLISFALDQHSAQDIESEFLGLVKASDLERLQSQEFYIRVDSDLTGPAVWSAQALELATPSYNFSEQARVFSRQAYSNQKPASEYLTTLNVNYNLPKPVTIESDNYYSDKLFADAPFEEQQNSLTSELEVTETPVTEERLSVEQLLNFGDETIDDQDQIT